MEYWNSGLCMRMSSKYQTSIGALCMRLCLQTKPGWVWAHGIRWSFSKSLFSSWLLFLCRCLSSKPVSLIPIASRWVGNQRNVVMANASTSTPSVPSGQLRWQSVLCLSALLLLLPPSYAFFVAVVVRGIDTDRMELVPSSSAANRLISSSQITPLHRTWLPPPPLLLACSIRSLLPFSSTPWGTPWKSRTIWRRQLPQVWDRSIPPCLIQGLLKTPGNYYKMNSPHVKIYLLRGQIIEARYWQWTLTTNRHQRMIVVKVCSLIGETSLIWMHWTERMV